MQTTQPREKWVEEEDEEEEGLEKELNYHTDKSMPIRHCVKESCVSATYLISAERDCNSVRNASASFCRSLQSAFNWRQYPAAEKALNVIVITSDVRPSSPCHRPSCLCNKHPREEEVRPVSVSSVSTKFGKCDKERKEELYCCHTKCTGVP
jgi:hypothetical protein